MDLYLSAAQLAAPPQCSCVVPVKKLETGLIYPESCDYQKPWCQTASGSETLSVHFVWACRRVPWEGGGGGLWVFHSFTGNLKGWCLKNANKDYCVSSRNEFYKHIFFTKTLHQLSARVQREENLYLHPPAAWFPQTPCLVLQIQGCVNDRFKVFKASL